MIGSAICDHLEIESGDYRESDDDYVFRVDTSKRFLKVQVDHLQTIDILQKLKIFQNVHQI